MPLLIFCLLVVGICWGLSSCGEDISSGMGSSVSRSDPPANGPAAPPQPPPVPPKEAWAKDAARSTLDAELPPDALQALRDSLLNHQPLDARALATAARRSIQVLEAGLEIGQAENRLGDFKHCLCNLAETYGGLLSDVEQSLSKSISDLEGKYMRAHERITLVKQKISDPASGLDPQQLEDLRVQLDTQANQVQEAVVALRKTYAAVEGIRERMDASKRLWADAEVFSTDSPELCALAIRDFKAMVLESAR